MSAAFNDEPTVHDQLNRKEWVAALAKNIRQCHMPYVFGVHGDWGAGKTSFLHLLHLFLTGEPVVRLDDKALPEDPDPQARVAQEKIVAVWFEAWRFQHDPAPVVALLHQIRAKLSLVVKAKVEAKKIAAVTGRSLLGLLDKLSDSIYGELVPLPSAESIEKIGERYEAERFETPSVSSGMRGQLQEAIDELVGKDGRLVILVDDLDRCQPEAAFKLLEGIKIYLNLPRCVFVLAMDQRNLERAIAQCLPGASRTGETPTHAASLAPQARDYLEKICQDVWHLPLIPVASHQKFLRDQLFDEKDVIRPEEKDHEAVFLAILGCLKEKSWLPANARKLKSYLNTLRRFVRHCPLEQKADTKPDLQRHAGILLLMSSLYHFHPELYRRLEGSLAFHADILEWAKFGTARGSVFAGMEIAGAMDKEDLKPGAANQPDAKSFTMYPDPATGQVFRISQLVRELGSITETELCHYLLRHACA